MNELTIDPSEQAAEQAALIHSAAALDPATVAAPTAPTAPSAPAFNPEQFAQQAQASWMANVQAITGLTVVYALPQWGIQPAEIKPLNEALCECLETIFPGGVDGKYACWWKLLAATTAITVSRYIGNGNKLPPFGQAKPISVESSEPAAQAA